MQLENCGRLIQLKKNRKNSHELVWKPPIIGYDKLFWSYCIEDERDKIRNLRRDEGRPKFALQMQCKNGHLIKMTPKMFFIKKKTCIYCTNPGENGAVNTDESVLIFWNDDRFDPEQISENSDESFMFRCPYCGYDFTLSMKEFIFRKPKCTKCNDGRIDDIPDEYNNLTYWLK